VAGVHRLRHQHRHLRLHARQREQPGVELVWLHPEVSFDSEGAGLGSPIEVYGWCMTRTNIDVDDVACAAVMERFNLSSKRDAVNLALRRLAGEPLSVDEARALRGSGWVGELEDIRSDRTS
jgi:Arc/MetJ family transcription regulator